MPQVVNSAASARADTNNKRWRRADADVPPPSSRQGGLPVAAAADAFRAALATAGEGGEIADAGGVSLTPAATSSSAPIRPVRRRMRMITSCLECRRRKLGCNKRQPCENCTKSVRDCVYIASKLDEDSQTRLTRIKEKQGSLEKQLETDVAKRSTNATKSSSRFVLHAGQRDLQRIVADDVDPDFDEEEQRDLEASPMVGLDLTYDNEADDGTGCIDDVLDLGVRVGRMRITERIGGLNRPRIAEEIQAGITGSRTLRSDAPAPPAPPATIDDASDGSPGSTRMPDFLMPGATYIPPTSGVFFGQGIRSPDLVKLLPTRSDGDHLMQRYFEAVHPIARCAHWPSLKASYATFWSDVGNGVEPRASIQAVIFAAWFSAAVSMDEAEIHTDYVQFMKMGAETALSRANFLRTTRVETLQAFVMYLLPLCRDEISRAHSVLVGTAIRMAECMGLHRDGEAYGLNPLEAHVRRLIWHQLCFLDIRTCEAQGPRPAIRRDDYDTKLPLNCEEDELTAAETATSPVELETQRWTSTLLPLVRFEINEMMRVIWSDRRKLASRKTNLTAVLKKIADFRRSMHEKYNRFLDERIPICRYSKLVMDLLLYRLHAMVLHPYHANTANPMPERLNNVLIMSGVMIIEIAIRLETDPAFRDWAWYLGAYQQYQIALLLATEIFYRPQHPRADRIWACLDYVFHLDQNVPREQRVFVILNEIMHKTGAYMGMRKMRAPTTISKAVPDKQAVKDTPSPRSESQHPEQQQGQERQQQMQQKQRQQQYDQQHRQQQMLQQQQQQQAMDMQMNGMAGIKMEPKSRSASIAGNLPMLPVMPPQPPGMHPPATMMANPLLFSMPPFPPALPDQYMHPLPPMPPFPEHMVFAGVSNGEVLWGMPPLNNANSPEYCSSDGGSAHNHYAAGLGMPSGQHQHQYLDIMENVDMEAIDRLLLIDPRTGEFMPF
ncbi:putative transcriptional regulatory protein-like protein 12 [Diplogelasinospora grovesii]|uniref:Transcriptional regulatory protein-like protein 12 n=1 Tax=Diplogelasinospora grovesii TaxID=303347 RepID=A0AAN6NDS6_9PEZI|nr:putative transcriptional regulatory protein-like protein 12 [Diplogelasinospora grovesii]